MNHWPHFAGSLLNKHALLTLLLVMVAPYTISMGCGPQISFEGYSFVSPYLFNHKAAGAAFFSGFETFYRSLQKESTIKIDDNVEEWRQRFCKKARAEDIRTLIYQLSESELQYLRFQAEKGRAGVDFQIAANSFAAHLVRNQCVEVLDYLVFAKRCEPHVTIADPWEMQSRDQNAMFILIAEGLAAFNNVESHYVKLRYAYQVVRLAHYARDYEQAIELYEYLLPKIDFDPSIIEYWTMAHYAGALLAMGQNVKATYLFSKVFANCPSKRESSFLSYRIDTDEEWQQCLRLCVNDQERSTLYAMRASSRNSNILEEMQAIYSLFPQSEDLEVLAAKAVKNLEKDLLGHEYNEYKTQNKRYYNIPRPDAGRHALELLAFCQKAYKEAEVTRPNFWRLLEGYIEMLVGNNYDASNTFKYISGAIKEKTLKDQLDAFQLALKINAYEKVDEKIEEEVADIQRNNLVYHRFDDFANFLGDKLAYLYKAKNPGKAFLCQYGPDDLKPNPKLELLDDLITVCNKDRPNAFERNMINKEGGTTILYDLLNMKATYQLSQFQPEAALETLKSMNRASWDDYGQFNPFLERVNDCVNCPLPDTVRAFNRGELLERLIDLDYKARAEPENSPVYYYQLGLAYYNMTYFSYSWKAMDFYRSGSSLQRGKFQKKEIFSDPYYSIGNKENFNCSKALEYFEKTIQYTNDPELAAKAAFMAAKCQLNHHLVYADKGASRPTAMYDLMLKKYRDTEFVGRAIRECKYFQAYAGK